MSRKINHTDAWYKKLLGADWRLLRKVARLSPAGHAGIILQRNLDLLGAMKHKATAYVTPWRCPHCDRGYPCYMCIYAKVVPAPYHNMNCCHIRFGGISYHELKNLANPLWYLSLGWKDARLDYDAALPGLVNRNTDVMHSFLQAHVDWAKRTEWWGEDYNELT